MKRLYAVFLFLAAIGWQHLAVAEENTFVKTYSLQWVQAQDISAVATELLGESGKVFTYKTGNELIVSASSNQHEQVAALIKDMDNPTPNVRLDVTINEAETVSDSALGVTGSGDVTVTHNGISSKIKFNPKIRNQKNENVSNIRQTLVVQSGREGYITIGEDIPYADWLFYYGRSWGYFDYAFTLRRIGTSLVAQPQVIGAGPMISITLVPEISGLAGEEHKRFRFIQAATTVTAYDGEPISIGGMSHNSEFYNKFLVGYDAGGKSKSMNITLTPRIVYPGKKTAIDLMSAPPGS